MVNLHTSHHGLGGYSKLINGLRTAASGTLYADVWAYCSHLKMYCKRARMFSSHPRLFIHSFILLQQQKYRSYKLVISAILQYTVSWFFLQLQKQLCYYYQEGSGQRKNGGKNGCALQRDWLLLRLKGAPWELGWGLCSMLPITLAQFHTKIFHQYFPGGGGGDCHIWAI